MAATNGAVLTGHGRFVVAARLRPKLPDESPAPSPLQVDTTSSTVVHSFEAEPYLFDSVHTERAGQREVRHFHGPVCIIRGRDLTPCLAEHLPLPSRRLPPPFRI